MNIEDLRAYCIDKGGTTEEFPFDQDTLVFKVMGKMYMLVSLKKWEQGDPSINVKCDPERALKLREQYEEDVLPGYHMSKIHWNTVSVNKNLPDSMIMEFIDHSYGLVVNKLTKKAQEELKKR